MFGHDDHHQDTSDNDNVAAPAEPMPDGTLMHDAQPTGAPVTTPATVSPSDDTDAGSFMDDTPAAEIAPPPAPVEPVAPSDPEPVSAPAAPADTEPAPVVSSNADELLDIKQQALQQLSPLVGHLEQTPEEKFRTTMMMIQAADNDALIKDAYTAAQQITDEKARAQALLDIVNEINYFTQHAAAPDAQQ
jgi:hypothetical protein